MDAKPEKAPRLPDYRTLVLIRRLLSEQGRAHWKAYASALALMGIVAACTAFSAYLIGTVINEAYVARNFPGIMMLGVVTVVLFTVKGLAAYGQAVILSRIGNRIIAESQRRLFAKLLNENIAFFSERHSSEFTARLTTGANAATYVLGMLTNALGRDALSLIGLVIVMVVQDPLLSMVSLFLVPPAFLVLRKLIRRIYAIARSQFTGGTRILETLQETLQGMRVVKAFTLEEVVRARMDANIAAVELESNKMARVANRASPLMETLGGFAIAVVLVYSGYRVINTGATPGQFFSFITAFLLAYEPAKRLARLNIDLNTGLVGVQILFEILDSPPSEPNDDDRPALALTTARIELRDVRFAYRPNEQVIRGISLVAEPGRLTALVGPSGGGKSTIFNLILRLYEIDGGAILIDGQTIADLSRRSIRRQIAYVGQDAFLFRGPVRENILLGRPEASEAEIVAAARAACAHDFITAFPLGYDTPVGEHGQRLSGGERQRIAVARALIRNAPIILLDEATGSLDAESERLVQLAIEHLCSGRTTLAIAHRLHTVTHADRIHVIESGCVAESGRHEDLLRRGGRYATFYRLLKEEQEPRAPVAAIAAAR